MKTFKGTPFALLLLLCAALFCGSPATMNAQTSVPAYTTVVADSWSYWEWDCYGWDYHDDYDWWWGPSWYYGAGWYSGYDWDWTPSGWWWDYLYYYYCYYVWVEIWGESLVQVPNTNGNCSYNVTVNFSDGSTQSFTQQGNGGTINLFFTHSATDPVPTGASATETCSGATVVDLVIKKGGADVTNQTTNLVIGEPVQFTVEPGPNAQNMTIAGVQWSQPYNAYKSYTYTISSGATTALDLGSATFDGFFVSPRTDEEIVATVSVNNQQHIVKTKVTVSAPGSSFTTSTQGVYVFTDAGFNWRIGWQSPGITFNYSQDGAAGSGDIFLIQTVTKALMGGLCMSNWQSVEQLDEITRVDGETSPIYGLMTDNPSVALPNNFYNYHAEHRFVTYLMFRSSNSGSYPVAIRKVIWGWNGSANNLGGGGYWQLASESHSVNPSSIPIFDLPTWIGNFKFTSPPLCSSGGGGGPIEP